MNLLGTMKSSRRPARNQTSQIEGIRYTVPFSKYGRGMLEVTNCWEVQKQLSSTPRSRNVPVCQGPNLEKRSRLNFWTLTPRDRLSVFVSRRASHRCGMSSTLCVGPRPERFGGV